MAVDLELVEKWAPIFATIGSTERLAILLVLHGSNYTRGKHCLTFIEIKDILGLTSDVGLNYHLQKLIDADLIKESLPRIEKGKGRIYPLYSVTEKWVQFVKESGLNNAFLDYVKRWKTS